MLMHIIGSEKQAFGEFAFGANGEHLAARIIEFAWIVWQQTKVQSVSRKLGGVEVSLTRSDGDVACRQLTRRDGLGINIHRDTSQARRKAGLAWIRGVRGQAIKSVYQIAGQRIGPNLGVVHRVAAPN